MDHYTDIMYSVAAAVGPISQRLDYFPAKTMLSVSATEILYASEEEKRGMEYITVLVCLWCMMINHQ